MTSKKESDNLNKKALVSGSAFVATQMLVRSITFLLTPIFTRLVSTEQYGIIHVYESTLLLTVPIFSLCLYRSVERAKFDFKDKFDEFVSSALTLSLISIFVAFLVITLFFKDVFMQIAGLDTLMYIYMILYTVFYTSYQFYIRKEKQLLRYKQATAVTIIATGPATVLSVILVYFGNRAGKLDALVDLRTIGFYTPMIIGGIAAAYFIYKTANFKVSTKYWKYGLAYSLPLIPEMISITIMNQSDKLMVKNMVGAAESGIFSLATTVSAIIWILEDSVWNAWLPWLYEKINRDEKKDAAEMWQKIVILFSFISWMLVLLGPEIILVLGGKKYAASVYLIAPMVTGTLFRFSSFMHTAVQNYYKKTKTVAIGTVLAMIINVILNYVCILKYGYQAAAYTTAVSYLLLVIIQCYLEKRVTGSNLFPPKRILLILISVFAINTATMLLFGVARPVRYLIAVLAMAIMFYVCRPYLSKMLEVFKFKKTSERG